MKFLMKKAFYALFMSFIAIYFEERTMSQFIESLMYQASQVFLLPALLAIALLFAYAFFLLGAFGTQWWQRRAGLSASAPGQGEPARGHPLVQCCLLYTSRCV